MHRKTVRQTTINIFNLNYFRIYGAFAFKVLLRLSFNCSRISNCESSRFHNKTKYSLRASARTNRECKGLWYISEIYSAAIVKY